MTTPQQPPAGQQPPPQDDAALDAAALVVALSALLVTAVNAAAVIAVLKARFALSRAAWSALGAVLGDVMSDPAPRTGVIGHASEQVSRMNAARRAQYVVAASKRVRAAARDARAHGRPVGQAVQDQLATERRYFAQHKQAMWDRAMAAGRVDMEAAVHGPLLGWNAVRDKRVTVACLKADGCNFYVNDPPDIGLPGIGPHVGCRCYAGPPHPGGRLLRPARGRTFARPGSIRHVDLSWHDAWKSEARGENGQWVSMTRGAYLGDDDPVKLAAVRRNPAAFIRTANAGRHWTANRDVSRQYAMGSDEDKRPGRFGVIMHGTVHHSHILPPGHPDIDAGVWQGPDSAEQEYPLRAGAQVNVTHVTVAWRDKNGDPHTETHPVQMTVQTAARAA